MLCTQLSVCPRCCLSYNIYLLSNNLHFTCHHHYPFMLHLISIDNQYSIEIDKNAWSYKFGLITESTHILFKKVGPWTSFLFTQDRVVLIQVWGHYVMTKHGIKKAVGWAVTVIVGWQYDLWLIFTCCDICQLQHDYYAKLMMIWHVIYISQYIIECLICVFEPFGHKYSAVQIKRSGSQSCSYLQRIFSFDKFCFAAISGSVVHP